MIYRTVERVDEAPGSNGPAADAADALQA